MPSPAAIAVGMQPHGSIVSTHKNQIAAGTSDNARRFSGCVRKLYGLSAVVTKQPAFMFHDKPFTAIGTFYTASGKQACAGYRAVKGNFDGRTEGRRLWQISVSRRVKAPAGKRITVLWLPFNRREFIVGIKV